MIKFIKTAAGKQINSAVGVSPVGFNKQQYAHTHLMGSPVYHEALAVCRCSLPSVSWLPAAFPAPLQRAENKNDHPHNHHDRERKEVDRLVDDDG